MFPWSHPPSKKQQLTWQLTCGIKLTWIQMMFSRLTRNWNCLKASTKGMPSMSPITPPSCHIHRDGIKCIQKPRNYKSVMQITYMHNKNGGSLYTVSKLVFYAQSTSTVISGWLYTVYYRPYSIHKKTATKKTNVRKTKATWKYYKCFAKLHATCTVICSVLSSCAARPCLLSV